MRNLSWILSVLIVTFLAFTVFLPILGFILFMIVLVLAVGAFFYLAAPLLAKLPWFRDRIRVERSGNRRTIRFGGTQFTSYQGWGGANEPSTTSPNWDENVIDVEGRPLSFEGEDEAEEELPQVLPPPKEPDRF